MNTVSDTEERIQGRLVTFFQDALGYEYLGDWQSRENNSNIDKTLLTKWLRTQRHNDRIIKKVPNSCLVYVLVHEMTHLLERHHNDRFRELMDTFLPQWRTYRDELNKAPLAHENWQY